MLYWIRNRSSASGDPASGGAGREEWKSRLGILGKYTEANVDFAIQEGFNNMILNAGAGTRDWIRRSSPTSGWAEAKDHLAAKSMHMSPCRQMQITSPPTPPKFRAPEHQLCEDH